MKKTEYAPLKAEFLNVFANVPSPLRVEIIAVVDGESFSWYTANGEIEHDTSKAEHILQQLRKINVI